jgi:hypothetical protein
MFIMAASVHALLRMYHRRYPDLIARMSEGVAQDRLRPQDALGVQTLYDDLPKLDFSRDVLQGQEAALRVLTVPHCGWSDLGTPQRVAEALRRSLDTGASRRRDPATGYLSLAEQHYRQQGALCLAAPHRSCL